MVRVDSKFKQSSQNIKPQKTSKHDAMLNCGIPKTKAKNCYAVLHGDCLL